MDGFDAHRQTLGKWAKGLYVLAGLKLLLDAFLVAQGYVKPVLLGDPAITLLLAAAIHAKTSRASAAALVVSCLWSIADHITAIVQGQQLVSETFAYADETIWLLLAIDALVALTAARCAVEAVRFHRSAGTRVIWRHLLVVTVVSIAYVGVTIFFAGLVAGGILDENASEQTRNLVVGIPVTILIAFLIALAIWRKLPGTRKYPVVVSAGEGVESPQPGTLAHDLGQISLAASLSRRTEDGGHVVSPMGVFGPSYRLTGEQFAHYVTWQQARSKRGAWGVPIAFSAMILAALFGQFIPLGVGLTIAAVGFAAANIVLVVDLRRGKMSFLREFPDAPPVGRSKRAYKKNFLFGYGAAWPGRKWHMVLSIVLFLLFALLAASPFFTAETVSWDTVAVLGALSLLCLASPLAALVGKKRFRSRYGLPLTAENLLAVKSGERPSPIPE